MSEQTFDVDEWISEFIKEEDSDLLDRQIFTTIKQSCASVMEAGDLNEIALKQGRKDFIQSLRKTYKPKKLQQQLKAFAMAASVGFVLVVAWPVLHRDSGFDSPQSAPSDYQASDTASKPYSRDWKGDRPEILDFNLPIPTLDVESASQQLADVLTKFGTQFTFEKSGQMVLIQFYISPSELNSLNESVVELGMHFESAGYWRVVFLPK